MTGTRPVVHPSAGKHHWYHDAGTYQYRSSDPYWLLTVALPFTLGELETKEDAARGDGTPIVPSPLHHVPQLEFGTAHQPAMTEDGRFYNACAYVTKRTDAALATHLQTNDLRKLYKSPTTGEWIGFANDTLVGEECFHGEATDCGSGVSSITKVLQDNRHFYPSVDGDTLPEISGTSYSYKDPAGNLKVTTTDRSDGCPLLDEGIITASVDVDGDGLGDWCDPDRVFRNHYVAGGAPGLPAANDLLPPPGLPPFSSYEGALTPNATRGGYADTDRDGLTDGEDLCPTVPSLDRADRNRWGQVTNWAPGANGAKHNELGVLYRGDACDPYPVAAPSVRGPRGTACSAVIGDPKGGPTLTIQGELAFGVSHNDPAPAYDREKAFEAKIYRCGCPLDANGEPDLATCLDSQGIGACVRRDLMVAEHRDTSGRGWRELARAGCAMDPDGYCLDGPTWSAFPDAPRKSEVLWSWQDELIQFPPNSPSAHFGASDFDFLTKSDGTPDYSAAALAGRTSRNSYVFWTEMELGSVPPYTAGGRYPDPESLDTELTNLSSLKSKRLRSAFTDQTGHVLHGVPGSIQPIPCVTPAFMLRHWRDFVRGPASDPPGWLPKSPAWETGLRVLASGGSSFQQQAILRPYVGSAATVTLSVDAAQSWIGASTGSGVLLSRPTFGSEQNGVLAFANTNVGATVEPDLLWVEQSGADANRASRWARLAVTSTSDASFAYSVVQEGVLPIAVGSDAVLLHGARGNYAALVDPTRAAVYGFDPAVGVWVRGVPTGALPVLGEATAMLLDGATLYAALSPTVGATTSELVAIDVFGGGVRRFPGTFPARLGARLSVASDGRGLILTGGRDAQERPHDDVWGAPFGPGGTIGLAARLRADTGGASFDAAGAMVFADILGVEVASVGVSAARTSSTVVLLRDELGWDDVEQVVAHAAAGGASCPASDPRGGLRCALAGTSGAEWWSGPGVTTCASAGGTCQGTQGALTANGLVHELALDFSIDGGTVWTVSGAKLSRHRIASGAPGRLATREELSLLAPGAFAVSAHAGEALVASPFGVALACTTGSKPTLTRPQPLCGAPVALDAYGDGWVVATTRGVALVSRGVAGRGPRVTALGLVDDDRGTITSVPVSTSGDFTCPWRGERELGAQRIVTVKAGRVLLSRDRDLFELDLRDPAKPTVTRLLRNAGRFAAMRHDAIGDRLYALASPWSPRGPIFDLRGATIAPAGEHTLSAWVQRRDDVGMSARRNGLRVELAEVVR